MSLLLGFLLAFSLLLNVYGHEPLFSNEQQQIIEEMIKKEVNEVELELRKQFESRESFLINQIGKLESKIETNQKSIVDTIDLVRNPPTSFYCGTKRSASLLEAIVTYDTLFYSRTNIEDAIGLDVKSGIFTSDFPGTYTVSYSLHTDDDVGDPEKVVYVRKNGEILSQTKMVSGSGWAKDHENWDQGSMTFIVHLEKGDQLDLWCEDCQNYGSSGGSYDGAVWDIMFCTSMVQFDPVL
eukprot:TRINITY_DN21219_c0_g1_i1.p1 TRINITY_DN21219_c0_g1~~TRINITY_DN21219_c0_g1_i1.p1  ORF type:complete len:239 (+),score=47.09 TRINITY_DN21219_c0_g1_i1:134-850(+)